MKRREYPCIHSSSTTLHLPFTVFLILLSLSNSLLHFRKELHCKQYLTGKWVSGLMQFLWMIILFLLCCIALQTILAAPDDYTFPPLLKCCSGEMCIRVVVGIHGLTVKYGGEGDLFVRSSLVDLYGKCRLPGDAQKVFDERPLRNVVSWTALLVALTNSGDLVDARKVFDEMPKRNKVSWNAMISGYAKLGEFTSARRLFDEMPYKNVVSYTAQVCLMKSLTFQRRYPLLRDAYDDMMLDGVPPTRDTFHSMFVR